MSLEGFKAFFNKRSNNVKLFGERSAKVHSALIDLELKLQAWLSEAEKTKTKSTHDLRAQLFEPEVAELARQSQHLKAFGKRKPGDAWVKQAALLKSIEKLSSRIEAERSIPYTESVNGFACTILDYSLVPQLSNATWVNTDACQITVTALVPKEFAEDAEAGSGGVMLYALTQSAAADAVAPYRERAAKMVSDLSKKIEATFTGRTASTMVTTEERNALVEDMNTLNRKLHAMAEEAADVALSTISAHVNELKNKQPEARKNWIFRFVKKLILGIASLGVNIARLVVSSGADVFAYVGGVKAIIAISSEVYDAFKSAQLVHTQLKKNINELAAQLLPLQGDLKSQTKAGAKEIGAKLLGGLGLTPGFISLFLTTCGGTADNLVLFRSKLCAINVKCSKMLTKVYKALDGVAAVKKDPQSNQEALATIPLLERLIDKLLKSIVALQATVSGFTLEAIEADVVLKNYCDAYGSIIPASKEQENFGIGDVMSIFSLATGIDKCFGNPCTDAVVDVVKSAAEEVKQAVAA